MDIASSEHTSPQDPVARARGLRAQIGGAAQAIERERALPRELLHALHDSRLFRLLLPKSCGGEEVAPAVFVAAVEEVAKADASVAWCMAQGSGCSMAAAYLEPAVAQEIFGGREAVLAWGPGAANATARAVQGGYRVSGSWPYASGSRHAQWLGGHAQLLDAQGKACLGPDGKPAERTLLFPKAKAAIKDLWHVVGLKGTGSDTYTVTDLFVSARYSFTRESAADRRESGPLYRFTTFQLYGCGFAAVALGIARATLDAFIAMAAVKIPMLGAKPVRENAVVQAKVASAEARWQSARAYLMQTLDAAWAAASRGESLGLQQRAALRLAGVYATEQAREVVEIAYHLAGGAAIFEKVAFERRLRDMHAVTQQVQGQFVNFEHVGQVLLGLPSASRLI
ncbi:MAG: acyl-CoA dehydrogenase family protein [Xanthobacteraceae bacterium]